jgi:hypothetical protein
LCHVIFSVHLDFSPRTKLWKHIYFLYLLICCIGTSGHLMRYSYTVALQFIIGLCATKSCISGKHSKPIIHSIQPSADQQLFRSCSLLLLPQSQGYCTTDCWLGKDKNSETQVWCLLNAYCFCTVIKSLSCKCNHHNLKTTCIVKPRVSPVHSGPWVRPTILQLMS